MHTERTLLSSPLSTLRKIKIKTSEMWVKKTVKPCKDFIRDKNI